MGGGAGRGSSSYWNLLIFIQSTNVRTCYRQGAEGSTEDMVSAFQNPRI